MLISFLVFKKICTRDCPSSTVHLGHSRPQEHKPSPTQQQPEDKLTLILHINISLSGWVGVGGAHSFPFSPSCDPPPTCFPSYQIPSETGRYDNSSSELVHIHHHHHHYYHQCPPVVTLRASRVRADKSLPL